MIVYLAELSHDAQRPAPAPLAAGYLAAALSACFPDLEIVIFVDPHALLAALQERPPDVLGLTLRLWSERLSAFCAREAKQVRPSTFVVVGGPSVPSDGAEFERFLLDHPDYDQAVVGEGEAHIVGLIDRLLALGSWPDPAIDLSEAPSPYLMGWLDPFLAEGCAPVIQSSRGCPYSCRFCVSGRKSSHDIRPFPLKRVYAELDHARAHAKSDYLILADENLGIFCARDVELARHIRRMHDATGWPRRLYAYTAKIVTPYVRDVVEALQPLAEFCQAFQTLDPKVRSETRRTNQKTSDFLGNVAWAKKQGILTSTEIIFGLPGETLSGYLAGAEWLLRSGVDRVYSYNLKLLDGSDLATAESRERCKYQTRWRLTDKAFGRYNGCVVTEAEEVVVGSDSFDFDDYMASRRYGLFLELASGRGYLTGVMRMMIDLGLPGERLVRCLAERSYRTLPHLDAILVGYHGASFGELRNSPEACTEYVSDCDLHASEVKLNYAFTDRIVNEPDARRELVAAVREFVTSGGYGPCDGVLAYIDGHLDADIVAFKAKELG